MRQFSEIRSMPWMNRSPSPELNLGNSVASGGYTLLLVLMLCNLYFLFFILISGVGWRQKRSVQWSHVFVGSLAGNQTFVCREAEEMGIGAETLSGIIDG